MSAIKLREGIWSVGILNPALRVFDIVMESKYGTSYNAYLLTGEKNVLIETVHLDYWDEFVSNVEEVLPLEQVDYLIMNHTEPDHSGSVARLLERCPNLTVLCTTSAKKFLTAIANRALPCRVVKDGDTLDLGNKVLHFLTAPLLHWPDSMFTWDPVDRTLFTCDFLGAHFCEPTMKDTGIRPVYRNAYEGELRYYFDCIFGPFKPSVLAGLDKMPAEQKYIYFAAGDSTDRLAKLPSAELVLDKGFDVLLLTEDVDEFCLQILHSYPRKDAEGKDGTVEFKNVNSGDLGLETEDEKKAAEDATAENKPLFDAMKDALDGKVKEVKVSTRLKDHPVCLSADGPLSIEMEKVLSKQPGSEGVKSDKVLELNINHPVFAVLKAAQDAGDTDKVKKYSSLLYAQAQLIEGLPVDDPAAYAEAVCSLMK